MGGRQGRLQSYPGKKGVYLVKKGPPNFRLCPAKSGHKGAKAGKLHIFYSLRGLATNRIPESAQAK